MMANPEWTEPGDFEDRLERYADRISIALRQYQNDMRYPPDPGGRARRIAMLETLIRDAGL